MMVYICPTCLRQVCSQRPEGFAEALPLAFLCLLMARLLCWPLTSSFMLQRSCLWCRWVAVFQGP